MEHTTKWVLAPSESETSESSLTEKELLLSLELLSKNLIDCDGKFLHKDKKNFIRDSSIYECLVKKKHAKHFARFLELKSQLTEKTLKRKKTKWEMNDD